MTSRQENQKRCWGQPYPYRPYGPYYPSYPRIYAAVPPPLAIPPCAYGACSYFPRYPLVSGIPTTTITATTSTPIYEKEVVIKR